MNERDTTFMEGARALGWDDARSIVSLLAAIERVKEEVDLEDRGGAMMLFSLRMALAVMFEYEGDSDGIISLEDQLWKLAEDTAPEAP